MKKVKAIKSKIFLGTTAMLIAVASLLVIPVQQSMAGGQQVCNGHVKDVPDPVDICKRSGSGCSRLCGFLEFK